MSCDCNVIVSFKVLSLPALVGTSVPLSEKYSLVVETCDVGMHCEVAPKLLSPLNTGVIMLVMTSSSSSDAENDS